jgi:hypothetical protein
MVGKLLGHFDFQRDLVYKSERVAFSNCPILRVNKAKLIFASIISSSWFLDRYSSVKLNFYPLQEGKSIIYHHADYGNIYMDPAYIIEPDIYHELSHAVVQIHRNENYHGAAFCRRYLRFVRYFMGDVYCNLLKSEFKKNGVCF